MSEILANEQCREVPPSQLSVTATRPKEIARASGSCPESDARHRDTQSAG